MLIDWFTVVAQALNFLILVWLMKRFLYKPILNAIDEREKRIALSIADAKAIKAEAKIERDEYQRKNDELELQRATLLKVAVEDAQSERRRLLDEARQAADTMSATRLNLLKNDARNLSNEIRLRTQQEVFAIARKTLMELAGTSLEERIVDSFVSRLRGLREDEKGELRAALNWVPGPAIIRTVFDLPAALGALTESAVKETIGSEIQVQFETVPELICGIELVTGGYKVAWSIAEYLTSMESSVAELLTEKKQF